MIRTERIVDETAIAHELSTYNDLIPARGELSATLFLEFLDPEERRAMSTQLAQLEQHLHLKLGDRVASTSFRPLPGEESGRLPAVNYVRFAFGDPLPLDASRGAIRVDHAAYAASTELSEATIRELLRDLS